MMIAGANPGWTNDQVKVASVADRPAGCAASMSSRRRGNARHREGVASIGRTEAVLF
jgi:hypothetical protein